jgi:hypothetical protein
MHALLTWWRQRLLSPAAARVVYLERRLLEAEAVLIDQHTLVQHQRQAIHNLQAALRQAQRDTEGWREISLRQSRQLRFRSPQSGSRSQPTAGPQLPQFLP